MDTEHCDVAICGAGPAGLAAATVLERAGLRVRLLDENIQPGGQLLRHTAKRASGGVDRARRRGLRMLDQRTAKERQRPSPQRVIGIFPDREILAADAGEHVIRLKPRAVILATGARERYLPFAGWTLPGVMGAGAAQILVKTHGVLPARRLVAAGAGPLIYAPPADTATAGGRVAAVLDQAGWQDQWRLALALCRRPAKMLEGAAYIIRLQLRGCRMRCGWRVRSAEGRGRLEQVVVSRSDAQGFPTGAAMTIAADGLAIGWGLVANLDLASQAGCRLAHDARLGGWVVDTDQDLATSVPGIYAAGEVTGIGGGAKALVEGELAALGVLTYLGGSLGRQAEARRRRLNRLRRGELALGRALADASRVPPGVLSGIPDDTVICRCEDVTMGEIRQAVFTGADSLLSLKRTLRLGMGICQGRTCGPIVADVLALLTRGPHVPEPPWGTRAPIKPVTLEALAGGPET
jgi:thioredoxin reductase/bacterioferritin-associated ferredoxin